MIAAVSAGDGGLLPAGSRQLLRWTLRRPSRPLTYHGAHLMSEQASAAGAPLRLALAGPVEVVVTVTGRSGGRVPLEQLTTSATPAVATPIGRR